MADDDEWKDGIEDMTPSLDDVSEAVGDLVTGTDVSEVVADLAEGGLKRVVIGAIRRASPNEKMKREVEAQIEETALRVVPEIERRLAVIEGPIFAALRDQIDARRTPLHDEVLRLVANGTIDPSDLREDSNVSAALYHAYKAVADAIHPDVGPPLARLTVRYRDRPLDSFFRGASRTLIELDGDKLRTLTNLFSAGVEYLRFHVLAPPTEPVDGTAEQKAHWSEKVRARFFATHCTLNRSNERPTDVFWSAAQPWNDELETPVEFDCEEIVHLLVTHRLAKDVSRMDEAERTARRFVERDDPWEPAFMNQRSKPLLSVSIETMVELHYALSNDRTRDGRSTWPWAAQLLEERRPLTPEEVARAVQIVQPEVSDAQHEGPPIDPYEGAARPGGMDPYEGAAKPGGLDPYRAPFARRRDG